MRLSLLFHSVMMMVMIYSHHLPFSSMGAALSRMTWLLKIMTWIAGHLLGALFYQIVVVRICTKLT